MDIRIRQVRREHGLTQTEFGERLGVSRSVISNIELNRVVPNQIFVSHLCLVFHISEKWLTHGTGEMYWAGSRPNKALDELWRLYKGLKPEFQQYVLSQISQLLALQNADKEP